MHHSQVVVNQEVLKLQNASGFGFRAMHDDYTSPLAPWCLLVACNQFLKEMRVGFMLWLYAASSRLEIFLCI